MVVIALVQNNTDEPILTCGFGVFNGFKKEVVENTHFIKDMIEEPVLNLNVSHFLNVYNKNKNYWEFIF